MYAWVLLLCSIVPQPDSALRDRCDLTELNHFFDENGRLVFDQLIFLDFNKQQRRFDVVAWKLMKQPDQLPVRDWENGGYVTSWLEGDNFRVVRSRDFVESWLQYDPELAAREVLAKEHRRELRPARLTRQ